MAILTSEQDILRVNSMTQNNGKTTKKGENPLLASLSVEVDDIFFSLRKADQIIRRELNLLNQQKHLPLKKPLLNPINAEKLQEIIEQLPLHHLLVDEYVIYMLKNESNSIFSLIKKYNDYVEKRQNEPEKCNPAKLIDVDEKLVYYIRHLGAMTYHLNIHLNLLSVLLKQSTVVEKTKPLDTTESRELVSEYMVNEWGEQPGDVRFLEITIHGLYAIVTWTLEDLRGDAILIQDEGYWQLLNISTGRFQLEDFENAGVPSEIAQQILNLHHQKLEH
ncbi:MAG TPA: hypothetical protein DCE56_15525 [Cyanobacteria bacterium UBA8553]|nr:hypothetical protein [Cyanobacteria bacterium UBA8553]